MTSDTTDFRYSVPYNLALITLGSALWAFGIKAFVIPHNLVQGGTFGVALLLHYASPAIATAVFYFFLNLPLFIFSWFGVSRRFFLYSLYAFVLTTGLLLYMDDPGIVVKDQLYAAIAGGVLAGAGVGTILRSLGSGGGIDMLGVFLYQKYNIGIGKFMFVFNAGIFAFSFFQLETDLVIASLISVFLTGVVTDYVLSMFSQRKVVFVISDHSREIGPAIMESLKIGSTYLSGKGAYSGQEKAVLMTVINNIQLKRLEEVVFSHDDRAMFIVENTYNVIGRDFSKRKIY